MKKENQNQRILEYKTYRVVEKYSNHVICEENGKQVVLDKQMFLDYSDVQVNTTWDFYYNQKNGEYSYFSNLFSNQYKHKRFKDNTIYKGFIFKKVGKSYLIKFDIDKYCLIHQKEFLNGIKIGSEIQVYVRYNIKKGRIYFDIQKPILDSLYSYLIENNLFRIKLKIENIVEKESGYDYILKFLDKNIRFKVFLRKNSFDRINRLENNTYYLDRNYEILSFLLDASEEVERYFVFDKKLYQTKGFIRVSLDIEESFRESLREEVTFGKIIFYTQDSEFYIENRLIGAFKLNTSYFSLIELILLENLDKDMLRLSLEKDRYISIHPLDGISDSESEVLTDLVIVNRIQTFSKKIIYQLKFMNDEKDIRNYRMFIDEYEMDYLGEIYEIGTKIDKIKFKYNVKELFCFYTRLPYIENPLASLLKGKKIGDSVIGRVTKTRFDMQNNNFIEIVIDNLYRHVIPKNKLKRMDNFQISDFYKEGEIYEFYIEDMEEDRVSLIGYNPRKIKEIFDNIQEMTNDKPGDIISCYIKKSTKGLIGYYEVDGEQIEVYVPDNEISYLNLEYDFKLDIKYQFMVIGKQLPYNPLGLVLSRKRLSKNIKNELEYLYPLGSTIGGIYFTKDNKGFYFNLTDENFSNNIGDLVGYLPYNKIGLYPDVENFKNNLLLQGYKQYRIVKFPNNFSSVEIRKKSIELELIEQNERFNEIIEQLEQSPLVLNLEKENTQKLLEIDKTKYYFEGKIGKTTLVFSLDKIELEELKYLYEEFANKAKENSIYKKLFSLFKLNSNHVELFFSKINDTNNTFEVSFRKKIEELLEREKDSFIQDISEEFLFGDKILNIPIEIENKDKFLPGQYRCKIKYIDKKAILAILVDRDELLGMDIKVQIIKNTKDAYLGEIHGHTVVIFSNYILQEQETVICKVTKVGDEFIYAKLKSMPELMRNCGNYIEEYIKENINSFTIEQLQDLINNDKEKSQYVPIFKKYKSEIFTSRKVGKYLISKEEFSNGAFGKVYKGFDLITDQKVILKKYSADKTLDEYKSFKNEAILLSELDLPTVVKVFWHNDDEYIAEYIDGITYRKFLEGKRSESEKIKMLIKIANALIDIHLQNVYHLDIKPENILIDREGSIKLIDFGSSQSKYEEFGKYGTLIYSSPYQCLGYKNNEKLIFSQKDDIYSFGIVMYETMLGKPPYSSLLGEDGIIKGHLNGRETEENVEYRYVNPTESNPKFNKALEAIINKCLEADEEKRYEEIEDIFYELEKLIA